MEHWEGRLVGVQLSGREVVRFFFFFLRQRVRKKKRFI